MGDNKAIVLGATGLIGHLLVEQLLQDEYFQYIKVLVRRPFDLQHPKLQQEIVNFEDESSLEKALGAGDIIFSCIGTTMKNVKGDKQLYRKIDFDIPVNAGISGYKNGVRQYVLVSSVGADPSSKSFYLRLKGEVEVAITQIPFESIHIMRPSMLLGKRKESRPGEGIGKSLSQLLSFILISRLKKYKPIHAATVASAMIAACKQQIKGVHIYEYNDMMKLIAG